MVGKEQYMFYSGRSQNPDQIPTDDLWRTLKTRVMARNPTNPDKVPEKVCQKYLKIVLQLC